MTTSKLIPLLLIALLNSSFIAVSAFTVHPKTTVSIPNGQTRYSKSEISSSFGTKKQACFSRISRDNTALNAATPDLDVVALVAGQENYGLAIVCMGEALWSFLQAPSRENAKVFIPAVISALTLIVISGPMVTSGDASSVALGLEIATAVSVLLGASYVVRLIAPYSPSPKEIAFLGLLVALAGFFSFSQNLVVDGFVTLPSLPSIPLPNLPSLPF